MTKPKGANDDVPKTSVLARLGNVMYWLATGVGVLIGLFAAYGAAFGKGDERWAVIAVFAVMAIGFWGIGRAVRYVLAGR